VVLAGQWEAALTHPVGGLLARIGVPARDTIPGLQLDSAQMHRKSLYVVAATASQGQRVLDEYQGLKPAVVCGGLNLLRWAIARENSGSPLLVYGLGRIRGSNLRWWFNRIRGIEFTHERGAAHDCVTEIERLTGGVPFLLRRFEELLMDGRMDGDLNVDAERFEHARCRFKTQDHHLATELFDGMEENKEGSTKLLRREYEILKMITFASPQAENAADLVTALTDLWDEIASAEGLDPAPTALTPSDIPSLRLLHEIGLARVGDASDVMFRTLPFAKDDPVAMLARSMSDASIVH
jgi:hypothetical protein